MVCSSVPPSHVCVSWADEINYGLVVAVSNDITSWPRISCPATKKRTVIWPWKAPEGRGQSDIRDITFLYSIRKEEDLMFICCWNAHNKLRGKFGGLHGIAVHVNWQVAARYPSQAKPWWYEWWGSPFVSFPSDRSSIQHSLLELPNWISFWSFQVHPSVDRQSHPWLSEAHQLHYFLPELKYSRFQT